MEKNGINKQFVHICTTPLPSTPHRPFFGPLNFLFYYTFNSLTISPNKHLFWSFTSNNPIWQTTLSIVTKARGSFILFSSQKNAPEEFSKMKKIRTIVISRSFIVVGYVSHYNRNICNILHHTILYCMILHYNIQESYTILFLSYLYK